MPFDQKISIKTVRSRLKELRIQSFTMKARVYKQEIYTDPIHTKETANADWEDVSPELKTGSKEVGTENTVLNSDFLKQMKTDYTLHLNTMIISSHTH